MKSISISVLALTAIMATVPTFAGSCPKDMKAIDAELATMPSLSSGDMANVKALRAKGEKLHKAGSHPESVMALHEAKKILGI